MTRGHKGKRTQSKAFEDTVQKEITSRCIPTQPGAVGIPRTGSPVLRVAGSGCSEKNLPLLSTCIQPAFLTANKVLKERELRQHFPPCVKVKSDSVNTRKLPIVRSQAGQAIAVTGWG